MALSFDDRQLLPVGVHDATLEEVERCFARFQRSDRRIRLFNRLRQFLDEVKKTFPGASVIIDGSFVMGCIDEPGDIALILIVPPEIGLTGELKPHEYNLVSSRRVRAEYKFDSRTVNVGSIDEIEWIEFFGKVDAKWCDRFGWPLGTRKGLVRIIP